MAEFSLGVFGGGEIAKSELLQAEKLRLKIDYYPLHAKNPSYGQIFGEVHSVAEKYTSYIPKKVVTQIKSCGDFFKK